MTIPGISGQIEEEEVLDRRYLEDAELGKKQEREGGMEEEGGRKRGGKEGREEGREGGKERKRKGGRERNSLWLHPSPKNRMSG